MCVKRELVCTAVDEQKRSRRRTKTTTPERRERAMLRTCVSSAWQCTPHHDKGRAVSRSVRGAVQLAHATGALWGLPTTGGREIRLDPSGHKRARVPARGGGGRRTAQAQSCSPTTQLTTATSGSPTYKRDYKGGHVIYKGGRSIYKGGRIIYKGGRRDYKGGRKDYRCRLARWRCRRAPAG